MYSIAPSSILLLGTFLTYFFILLLARQRGSRSLRSIPGPKGYPLIGIGLSLPPEAIQVFRKWALEYGELFKLRIGWWDWVIINSPEAFKEIFDKQVSGSLD